MVKVYVVACVHRQSGDRYTVEVQATSPNAAKELAAHKHMLVASEPAVLADDVVFTTDQLLRQLRDSLRPKALRATIVAAILQAVFILALCALALWFLFEILNQPAKV